MSSDWYCPHCTGLLVKIQTSSMNKYCHHCKRTFRIMEVKL